jgi:hypothetical protein
MRFISDPKTKSEPNERLSNGGNEKILVNVRNDENFLLHLRVNAKLCERGKFFYEKSGLVYWPKHKLIHVTCFL